MIRTKIIATIGPASSDSHVIKKLIQAGVNVFRLNFSHGTREEHSRNIANIRKVGDSLDKNVAVMADIQGPKIRTGLLKNKKVILKKGRSVILTSRKIAGDEDIVSVDYKDLPRAVKKGMVILLNDGLIKLRVVKVKNNNITCTVLYGGELGEHKGVNVVGIKLIDSFTPKDRSDIKFAIGEGVDYFAISFVRNVKDVVAVKKFIEKCGGKQPLIAKIEKPEAVRNLQFILKEVAGVMVARGDLGVEGSLEDVPVWQKKIIFEANKASRFVITATQMLESMINAPVPTRAEVTDVANAIFDGTSAVMLSGETAMGKYPITSVRMMRRIIQRAERSSIYEYYFNLFSGDIHSTVFSVAHAAIDASYEADVKGIVVLTISGETAKFISKRRPRTPIFAFTPSEEARRQMAIFWGVNAFMISLRKNVDEVIDDAEEVILERKLLKKGDKVVVVYGSKNVSGFTDRMKIMILGDKRNDQS